MGLLHACLWQACMQHLDCVCGLHAQLERVAGSCLPHLEPIQRGIDEGCLLLCARVLRSDHIMLRRLLMPEASELAPTSPACHLLG